MIKWLRHVLGVHQRIVFRGKSQRIILLFIFLVLTPSGCNKSLGSQGGVPLVPPSLPSMVISQPTPPLDSLNTPEIVTATELPATPVVPTITPTIDVTEHPPILYYTQAGDTLGAVSARFDVSKNEITSPDIIPDGVLLPPNQLLIIPNRINDTGPGNPIFPDSEVVYSPSTVDFDISSFVKNAGGYLSTYREYSSMGWNTGAQVVYRVAVENSINPRLLLAILEFQSHWVYGKPTNPDEIDYPVGWFDFKHRGLYLQLYWAVSQLSIGYYGWRNGSVTFINFPEGTSLRLSPMLNAGSVGVQFLFSKLYEKPLWAGALYSPNSLTALYEKMFGNPFVIAQAVEPILPATLTQPIMELPFLPGYSWSYTRGPHSVWGPDEALAAIDFAPGSLVPGCVETTKKATASAPGVVVRSGNGVVVIDLDGDGFEQTGWALLYMHMATHERVAVGTWVNTDDPIGFPSCEGGIATGTHLHFARKYNGEWIPADGPVPFVLSGWQAHEGSEPYAGTLTKGNKTITSSPFSSFESAIVR